MKGESTEKVIGIVKYVIPDGKHGAYVKALDTCEKPSKKLEGYITFSIEEEQSVWTEKRSPKSGDLVVLEDIHKKLKGWRAEKARFYVPRDEKKRKQKTE